MTVRHRPPDQRRSLGRAAVAAVPYRYWARSHCPQPFPSRCASCTVALCIRDALGLEARPFAAAAPPATPTPMHCRMPPVAWHVGFSLAGGRGGGGSIEPQLTGTINQLL